MSKIFLFSAVLFTTVTYGQNVVSGTIDKDLLTTGSVSVFLYDVGIGNDDPMAKELKVAEAIPDLEGRYAFDRALFKPFDNYYRLSIFHEEGPFKEKESSDIFVVSDRDTIHFLKSSALIKEYTSNSQAQLEWKNLSALYAQNSILGNEDRTEIHKRYLKDSLEILIVKLAGLRTLDESNLLDQDINQNSAYYFSLLSEFESSLLEPKEYAYLTYKMSQVAQEKLSRKYSFSLLINVFSFLVIGGLLFLMWRKQRSDNSRPSIDYLLSKQEKNIKILIEAGKSNKEIASDLYLSISTVKSHLTSIYSKLGVTGRKQIISGSQ